MQWKLDNGAWGTLEQLKTSILSLSGDASGIKVYEPGQFATAFEDNTPHTIAWQWLLDNDQDVLVGEDCDEYGSCENVYMSSNEYDTYMGNLALDGALEAVVTVGITATQIDDLVTNANMLEGANQVVNLQDVQTLSFRSASDINNFERVEVNGEPIYEGDDYIKTEGSTVITLTESYIASLTADRYVIDIVSTDMTASTVFEVIDEVVPSSVLSENSWETISKVVKAGEVTKYGWSVGDKTTVIVGEDEYEVAIAGINHDGENTITFIFNESLAKAKMNSDGVNSGSWENSKIRTVTIPEILNQMENKDLLKEVEKKTIKGYDDGNSDGTIKELIVTNDKLFLLSKTEIFGGNLDEGIQYEYLKNQANRKIKPNENSDSWGVYWWTRSPSYNVEGEFESVDDYGSNDSGLAYGVYSVIPAFVIG